MLPDLEHLLVGSITLLLSFPMRNVERIFPSSMTYHVNVEVSSHMCWSTGPKKRTIVSTAVFRRGVSFFP
jgi:hypothetical protein